MMKISSSKNRTVARALVVSFVSLCVIGITRADDTARQVAQIVAQIQHADFAPRPMRCKGYDDLSLFSKTCIRVAHPVLARLRSMEEAINGFNDSIDPKELNKTSRRRSMNSRSRRKRIHIRRCKSRDNFMFGLPGFHEPARPGARKRISWPDRAAGKGSH
jgi:hypothetical protein